MSILITSKRFGPFLRMVYLVIGRVGNFFIIFFSLAACSAAVFTALFNTSSLQFVSFAVSMRTLYAASLATFNMKAFEQNEVLGGVLLGGFLLMANVMLLNLLIAILSNVYSDLIIRVDSEHRAVMIAYYDRYYWDERCGLLIFLPSPLTYLVTLASPLVLFSSQAKFWNNVLCRCFYIFYALPQFLIFVLGAALYLPLLYLKGFLIYSKTSSKKAKFNNKVMAMEHIESSLDPGTETLTESHNAFNLLKTGLWLGIGVPWLLYALLRDTVDFWMLIYEDLHACGEDAETTKLQQIVTSSFINDTQEVLKGIPGSEATVQQFLETWQIVDQAHAVEDNSDYLTLSRKQLAFEYFSQFANSNSDRTISLYRMRSLLPENPDGEYSAEYLLGVQHINVPVLMKAVKKYQQKIGSTSIGNLSIPKHTWQSKKLLDLKQIERLEHSVKELEKKYVDIVTTAGVIKCEMDLQATLLKSLSGGAQKKKQQFLHF